LDHHDILHPLASLFEIGFVCNQDNLGGYVGVFYAVAPRLVANQIIEGGLVNICIIVKGKGYIEGHVLQISDWNSDNVLQKSIVVTTEQFCIVNCS